MNQIASQTILEYRKTAKKLWQINQEQRQLKKQRALVLAQLAAKVLKEQFLAEKVVLFGSLIREDCFTLWSDVDLAVWGIKPNQIFKAMEVVRDLDHEIDINLVDIDTINTNLLISINKEGRLL